MAARFQSTLVSYKEYLTSRHLVINPKLLASSTHVIYKYIGNNSRPT